MRKCLNADSTGPCAGEFSTDYRICSRCSSNTNHSFTRNFLNNNHTPQTYPNELSNRLDNAINKSSIFMPPDTSLNSSLICFSFYFFLFLFVIFKFGFFFVFSDNKKDQMCGGKFNIKSGMNLTLTSPNYPSQYPTNIRCTFLVKVISNLRNWKKKIKIVCKVRIIIYFDFFAV